MIWQVLWAIQQIRVWKFRYFFEFFMHSPGLIRKFHFTWAICNDFPIEFQYLSSIKTIKGYSKAFAIKIIIPKIRKALLNSSFGSRLLGPVHTCDVSDAVARELRQNSNQCDVNRTKSGFRVVLQDGGRWRRKPCSRSSLSILHFKN